MAVNYHIVFAISCVFTSIRAADVVCPCTTPNDEASNCTSLFSCPLLMQAIGSQEPTAINFVKQSICMDCKNGDIMVCCGSRGNFSNIDTKTPTPSQVVNTSSTNQTMEEILKQRDYVKRKLLPTIKYCGLQHTDDRFYNSTTTALDEFPWLVYIRFSKLSYEDFGDRCSGVLISNRYVLTDAYCGAEAVLVRIGQYNTGTNVTCTNDPNIPECTDPIEDIEIESKHRSGKQENGPYDFTLLRLAKTITYTDYTRPICLPVNGSKRPENTLTLSGWGAGGPGNITKKRLTYATTENKACYDIGIGLEGNVKFANVTHICLTPTGENVDLACSGEHGGPIMYSYRHQWYAEGIVVQVYSGEPDGTYSTNFNICSNKEPVSGIIISSRYMDWILDNIKD